MTRLATHGSSLLAAVALSLTPAVASDAHTKTRYAVTITEDQPRLATVEATLTPSDGVLWMNDDGDQGLPHGWSTFVRGIEARGLDGETIVAIYSPLSRWQLQVPIFEPVSIRYEVLLQHDRFPLNFGDNGAAYFRDGGVMWSGRALFLAGQKTRDIELTLDIPKSWKATTPWLRIEESQNRFTIDTTEDLVNSAIMVGNHTERTVQQGPLELRLALNGPRVAAAEEIFSAELAKYLEYYDSTIGPAPRRSMIVIAADSSYWGGEVMGRAISLSVADEITGPNPMLAHLFAHETAHLWGLDINFSSEDEEELYWFYEGMLAEYFSYVAHLRLGEIDGDQFIAQVSENYSKYKAAAQPGLSMSAAGREKAAHYDLIYSGGMIAAAALDQAARENTGNTTGVETLMRFLYTEYPSSTGSRSRPGTPVLDSDSVAEIAAEVLSPELGALLRSWVEGSLTISLDTDAIKTGLNSGSTDHRSDATTR